MIDKSKVSIEIGESKSTETTTTFQTRGIDSHITGERREEEAIEQTLNEQGKLTALKQG